MGLLYSNYIANPTTDIKVNAVNGTLTKTLKKSFFKRFHMKSNMADYIFATENPSLEDKRYYNTKEIVVLQIMLCGDGEMLAEIIYKDDYEEIFKNNEEED